MQKLSFILFMLVLIPFCGLLGQNITRTQSGQDNTKTVPGNIDKVLLTTAEQDFRMVKPGNLIEYSICPYKKNDLLKTDALMPESPGIHTEVYISNTRHGVFIISPEEPDNILSDYNSFLQACPDYYDIYSRRDTLVVSTDVYNKPVFDFIRASSLRQDYKNAYNYSVDPRTRISWSSPSDVNYFLLNPYTGKYWNKNSDEFYNQEWGRIQGLNELVIVFPRLYIK